MINFIKKIIKNKNMENLKIDKETALRLYPNAAPEFKEMLECTFGKDFFNKPMRERINNYSDVCKIIGISECNSIKIEAEGLTDEEKESVISMVRLIHVSKAYNKGIKPTRNKYRYYPYYNVSGSGFAFNDTSYDVSLAHTASASCLSYNDIDDAKDSGIKFIDFYKKLINV